jgi:AraC-like DNA-binding protein
MANIAQDASIKELRFSDRKSAERHFSQIAHCIADVSFQKSEKNFHVTYAGGSLGRCGLHQAKVAPVIWSVVPSDEVHLIVLKQGSLTVRGSKGESTAIAHRSAILLPPSASGRAIVSDDTIGMSIIAPWHEIRAEAVRLLGHDPTIDALPQRAEEIALGDPVFGALTRNAGTALNEMLSLGQIGLSRVAQEHLDELVLGLFATTLVDELRVEPPSGEAGPSIVRRAQDFIRANAADAIRLSELATDLGIGMRALQIAFRKNLGLSPRDYLMQCRLDLARARLLSGDPRTRISTVAFDCGFTDLALFSRKYRQAFGELPSATLRRR